METRHAGGRGRLVAGLGALALISAACADDEAVGGRRGAPVVVATMSIWADVVANVACDGSAEVESLIPAGGDPHEFEPSLADRARLESAALIVANGLSLEEGLEDTLVSVEAAGTPVIRLTDHVDIIASSSSGPDPHIWFDPTRISDALPVLAEHLVEDAGLEKQTVDDCMVAYREELDRVDAMIAEMVATVPADRRELVTNHDSLGYFADRYGLEILGTVIPSSSTLAETNPAALEQLAELMEDNGVRTIFSDARQSPDDAEALADRVGVAEVVSLLTGGLGDAESGSGTYVDFLLTNARLIVAGLLPSEDR